MCLDRDSAMRDLFYLLTLFWIPLDTIGNYVHLTAESPPLDSGSDFRRLQNWAVFSDISLLKRMHFCRCGMVMSDRVESLPIKYRVAEKAVGGAMGGACY